MPELVYEPIPKLKISEIESAIDRDDPDELLIVVLSAALHLEDPRAAQEICFRLAQHSHFNVRGNSLLGFAHIARIHGILDESTVKPLILGGLDDENQYVREKARDARGDLEFFLSWRF